MKEFLNFNILKIFSRFFKKNLILKIKIPKLQTPCQNPLHLLNNYIVLLTCCKVMDWQLRNSTLDPIKQTLLWRLLVIG